MAATGRANSSASDAGLRLGQFAQGKAQEIELFGGGGEQEIALVAIFVPGTMQLRSMSTGDAPRIMTGGERGCPQLACGCQKIAELDPLIAAHAGDRRFAGGIACGEILHHRITEALFVIQHVMGNGEAVCDTLGVVNILAGATGALAANGLAMVVEL